MNNFEEVLEQYEPMISAAIRNLNIYREHESFRQAGRVALWQAWTRFDEGKGNFSAFASRSIRGGILDELKKENRFEEHEAQMEDEILETVTLVESDVYFDEMDELAHIVDILSSTDRELVQWLFVDGYSIADCAEKVGITVAGIKKRRERLLVKLRSQLI